MLTVITPFSCLASKQAVEHVGQFSMQISSGSGSVLCAYQHSYDLLWEERRICSVANLTREDGAAFMRLASEIKLEIEVTRYPMKDANRALDDLRAGRLSGAAVLVMPDESHDRP
jgi:D-arabinose 1-dehydrogenase-like Zn-dependent alcohol dehydrogenase